MTENQWRNWNGNVTHMFRLQRPQPDRKGNEWILVYETINWQRQRQNKAVWMLWMYLPRTVSTMLLTLFCVVICNYQKWQNLNSYFCNLSHVVLEEDNNMWSKFYSQPDEAITRKWLDTDGKYLCWNCLKVKEDEFNGKWENGLGSEIKTSQHCWQKILLDKNPDEGELHYKQ